jgi:hypothetical protein
MSRQATSPVIRGRQGGGKLQSRSILGEDHDLQRAGIVIAAFPLPTLPRMTGEENE